MLTAGESWSTAVGRYQSPLCAPTARIPLAADRARAGWRWHCAPARHPPIVTQLWSPVAPHPSRVDQSACQTSPPWRADRGAGGAVRPVSCTCPALRSIHVAARRRVERDKRCPLRRPSSPGNRAPPRHRGRRRDHLWRCYRLGRRLRFLRQQQRRIYRERSHNEGLARRGRRRQAGRVAYRQRCHHHRGRSTPHWPPSRRTQRPFP